MKKNNLTSKIIFSVVLFCLLYIILAFHTLSTELHLAPEWTEDIMTVSNVSETEETIPFRLGQNIGYFTPDGRIASRISYPSKAAISEKYYTTYGTDNMSTEFYESNGKLAGTIDLQGFPYFDSSRIYVFLPGGNAFVSCDSEGNTDWRFETYAPITAFSTSDGGVVAGIADGTVVAFDHNGNQTQKFPVGGSEIPVILGAAISEDGKTVACVSGQNTQRFVMVQKTPDGHSKVIFHEYLDEDFNEQVLVKFSKDGRYVFYNYKGGVGIVNTEKMTSNHVAIEGKVIQIEESENPWLINVLSKKESTYTVTVIEPEKHPLAQFDFDSSCAFIQTRGDKLFVGKDDKISCLTLSRK